MNTCNVTVNRLPVKTWNRLRMNQASVSQVLVPEEGPLAAEGESLPEYSLAGAFQGMDTGCGSGLTELLEAGGIRPRILKASGADHNNAFRLDYFFEDGGRAGHRTCLEVEEGSSAVVLMDFASPDQGAAGQGIVQTLIHLNKNARLHLVQIQRVGQGYTFFNDLGAVCEDGSALTLTQLVLSGAQSYTGVLSALRGAGSSLDASVAYSLREKDRLDMNYVARHYGRKTTSNISAAGTLRAGSFKLFRGTIDFIRGSAGAVGSEKEDVLLFDDSCINQTIPLILCEEEDVEGNHGASIGRPNEEVLFYLTSRGIPMEEAYALLARARLDAAAGRIPEDAFRQEILEYIKKGGAANG